MLDSYFTPIEQGVIAGAIAITLGACWAYIRERDGLALGLVLLVALALRLMCAQLDPFLNIWDESVHAVVAKNMVSHPFTPMLFTDKELGLDFEWWTNTRIWLHKQPFFLWMMAASIGTFGNTVFALRLPSVLFTTALVYFTHGIGAGMHGRAVAFSAAVMMAWSYWFLMLVLGAVITDHNDAIFISLVGGSFWAWSQWRNRMSYTKAIVIGLFMGCAVLTKWLPGFMLMGGWGMVALLDGKRRASEFRWMACAFLVACLVAVPWQISAWLRFPAEMAHEMALNALHLWTVVEGHEGGAKFYFTSIEESFGPFTGWLVFGGFLLSVVLAKRKDMRIMALTSVVVTYGLYSFAATKMSSFTMVVIPFLFIGLGQLVQLAQRPVSNPLVRSILLLVPTLIFAGVMFRVELIQRIHTEQVAQSPFYSLYRGANLHNMGEIRRLDRFIGDRQEVVVFHVPFPANMNMMFFHGAQVSQDIPTPEKVDHLLKMGRTVIIVDLPPVERSNMPFGTLYYDTDGEGFRIPPL